MSQAAIPGLGNVPIAIHDKTTVDLVIPRLTWLTEQTVGSGRLGFGLSLPYARVDQRMDFTSGVPFLAGDLAAQSAQASGRVSTGVSFGVPTGGYDRFRAANPGFGDYWSIRPFIINSHVFNNGVQIGAFTSYTFNTVNRDTHYRSGDFLQSDLMALFPVTDAWRLGVQGFVLKQTTDDRSDAAGRIAGNRAQALGLGPTIAYISDGDWGVDFKLVKEFAVRNRTEGVVSWLRLHMRID